MLSPQKSDTKKEVLIKHKSEIFEMYVASFEKKVEKHVLHNMKVDLTASPQLIGSPCNLWSNDARMAIVSEITDYGDPLFTSSHPHLEI